MTQDNLPVFHRLARNVISVGGYNGRGIAPGTVFGRCLARMILGELDEAEFPLPAKAVAPVRFKAVRGAYYELGAQAAHFAGARV
jgi:glycine/D-amino acid oxidase-like deaminating enzyme